MESLINNLIFSGLSLPSNFSSLYTSLKDTRMVETLFRFLCSTKGYKALKNILGEIIRRSYPEFSSFQFHF